MPERGVNMEKAVSLNVKLTPGEQADQPVLANYTTVGVAQGMGYLDFGFIEPASLAAVVRRAQQDGDIPKTLDGTLAVRVALPLEALARLQQQLQQVVVGLRGKQDVKS